MDANNQEPNQVRIERHVRRNSTVYAVTLGLVGMALLLAGLLRADWFTSVFAALTVLFAVQIKKVNS